MNFELTGTTPAKIAVLFDGRCYLCSFEISHYRKLSKLGKIDFIDITQSNFSAEKYKLSSMQVNRYLHVVNLQTEEIKRGVDAFVEIWLRLPGIKYRVLARLACFPVVKPIFKVAYFVFAVLVRPYLPKKRSCSLESL